MSDLVKTKFEIFEEVDGTIVSGDSDKYDKIILDKLLVLPSGLMVLEEMLKEALEDCKEEILDFHLEDDKHVFSDLIEYMTYRAGNINEIVDKHFSSVFARFKQEYGVE